MPEFALQEEMQNRDQEEAARPSKKKPAIRRSRAMDYVYGKATLGVLLLDIAGSARVSRVTRAEVDQLDVLR